MPRINAASIPEHVAQQEAAVIAAASRLFTERGFADVSLGDIADEVGLARTSLYRYFPSKAHIVHAWFEREMPALLEESRAVAADPSSTREERLKRWVTLQIRFLSDPGHDAMVRAAQDVDDLPDTVRAGIRERHEQLYATLAPIIGRPRAGGRAGHVQIRVMLVAGLIRSAGDLVRSGTARAAVERELLRATAAVAFD